MSSNLISQLAQFIGGIAALIFIHELGHYLAARFLHVEVEEFGIGFPPRAARLFEADGTVFTLNWIPLGGFVRLKGENDPDVPGGLAAANPWVRLGVIFAGPIMNLTLGILLSIIFVYRLGEPILDQVQIQGISQDSPAQSAGLQVGDIIIKVNDDEINSTDDLQSSIYANLGKEIRLTYLRGEVTFNTTLVPRDPPPEDGAIGILMGYPTQPTTWAKAIPSGINATIDYGRSLFSLPRRIFNGEISPEEGRPLGYKGMFDVYQQIRSPLWFFMVISLSLGIFNLLPIPALDGGRILFTLPEILIHRRIPQEYENVIHLIGFTMLIILLIYINVQDFVNPIQFP